MEFLVISNIVLVLESGGCVFSGCGIVLDVLGYLLDYICVKV